MSVTGYSEVSSYYDGLWADLEKQKKAGPNVRHFSILKNLQKQKLKKNSKVLEIGCGIGSLTRLISKKIKYGKITGVDISPKTIAFNKEKYKSFKNMDFMVSDMTDFSSSEKFDYVVLPDVLEHIPIEAHDNIFKTIKRITHASSIILINIPHPKFLEWVHKNKRDLLQIIDQPIHTNILSDVIYKNGFYIENIESYSLGFNPNDYQSIVLKSQEFENKYTVKSFLELVFINYFRNLFF